MGDSVRVTSQNRKFNPTHLSNCGGVLRFCIILCSFLALILGSIGSPNDLGSRNDQSSVQNGEFYGYGLGYIYEPLNVAYISTVIIAFLFSLIFFPMLAFEGCHKEASKMNRFVYLFIGIFLVIGIICGGIGTFNFWKGCCNVALPNPNPQDGPGGIQYVKSTYFTQSGSSSIWCRCNYITGEGDAQKHTQAFVYVDGLYGQQIQSATPHDFAAHGVSMGVSFIAAVLSFISVAIV